MSTRWPADLLWHRSLLWFTSASPPSGPDIWRKFILWAYNAGLMRWMSGFEGHCVFALTLCWIIKTKLTNSSTASWWGLRRRLISNVIIMFVSWELFQKDHFSIRLSFPMKAPKAGPQQQRQTPSAALLPLTVCQAVWREGQGLEQAWLMSASGWWRVCVPTYPCVTGTLNGFINL